MLSKVLAFGQVTPPGSSACETEAYAGRKFCFLAYTGARRKHWHHNYDLQSEVAAIHQCISCISGTGAPFGGRRTGLLAMPDCALEVHGEPGAVVLALLLLARLHVFPVDLALPEKRTGGVWRPARPDAAWRQFVLIGRFPAVLMPTNGAPQGTILAWCAARRRNELRPPRGLDGARARSEARFASRL